VDFLRSGMCKSGSACRYAHDPQEIQRAKMHKSGRHQSVVRAVGPPASLEVAGRHSHMSASQSSMVRAPRASKDGSSWNAKKAAKFEEQDDEGEDGGWLDMALGLSRQTTEEGAEPPLCLSPRSSNEDMWDDSTSASGFDMAEGSLRSEAAGACAREEEEDKEEMACELLVKHTFFSLEPVRAGSHRRIQSAPAFRRLVLA